MGKSARKAKAQRAKASRRKLAVWIVVGCVAVVFGIKYFKQISPADLSWKKANSRTKGNSSAGLQIVEYIDFQCPSCAKGSEMLARYFKKYPGKIRLELKYFPLSMHSHAFKSAYYTECAGRQGKFWPFHDLLIKRQNQWRVLNNAESTFQGMAGEIGLNKDELVACLSNKDVSEEIMRDKNEGQLLGIRSTPTYFFNQERVVGSQSLRKKLVDYFQEENN